MGWMEEGGKGNLVPRVSLSPPPRERERDPGNEVGGKGCGALGD